MTFVIPQSKIESLRGEASEWEWSEGMYSARFEKFEIRDLPATQAGDPFAGYETTDGTRLSVQLSDITPLEPGMKDPGNRKFFLDFVLGDGTHTLENVDLDEQNAPYWQLQKSAKLLGNLAYVMGEVEVVGSDVQIKDTFVDDLVNGQYAGQRIGFKLYNRVSKKNGKAYPEIETFLDGV